MYGMIHKAARAFTIREHGDQRWAEIAASLDMSDEHFISGQHYSDETTVRLLGAIAADLGVEVAQLLRSFGRYWVEYTAASDYASALEMCGDDLVTFLDSLDDLHRGIKTTMPEAVLPSFSVISSDSTGIELLYQSEREGLESFVTGLLEGVMARFSEPGHVAWTAASDGVAFQITRAAAN